MKKLLLTGIAALFLATGAAHATDTLALACKGTIYEGYNPAAQRELTLGVVVNLANKTVRGLPYSSFLEEEPKITDISETEIVFGWHYLGRLDRFLGVINRVTGDLSAVWHTTKLEGTFGGRVTYDLKCRPTQRIF